MRVPHAAHRVLGSVMPENVALLDFGSNAVRFVSARLGRRGAIFDYEGRVRVRLASGPNGSLSSEAIEHTLRAAERFLRRVKPLRPRILAVATASVRDAPNAHELLERLPELQVRSLRILSGVEEATFGAESALRAVALRHGAVIDLGGGSMQWTTIRNGKLKHRLSLPLGAARMTREHIRHDPPESDDLARVREAARGVLSEGLPEVRPRGRLVALGGTARALARRKLRLGADRPRRRDAATLTLAELKRIRRRLQALTIEERKQLRGMRPERADIVIAGALVLEQLMQLSGYEELTVCRASVREGFLWREAEKWVARSAETRWSEL
jgi:exopolyphosphatase / guanosine-5'-triphosphate,3'-diphosphate pyrophosphatase